MRLVRICTLFVAFCLVVAAGCKEDPMGRARTAHANERPDEAEAALKEVLAQSPKDFEARRLMADVHRFRGAYDKTEEELEALWKEKGFGDEAKEFPPEERAQRDLLENQFNELYDTWSGTVDPAKDPAKFEKVVRAGLVWNKKSVSLNRVLVDHLLARADALEKEGKLLEAADVYSQVLQLRALQAQRKAAQAKVDMLRKNAFADEVNKRVETLKPELVAAEQWNDESKTIAFTIAVDVDKRLKQKNEADLEKARKQATGAIRTSIAEWVDKMTGVGPGVAAAAAPKVGSEDEQLGRGKYSVKVALVLGDIIDAAYAAKVKADAASKEAENADGDPEAAPQGDEAPVGTNAGAADGGTTGKE